jgi:hypothetical protein
MEKRKRHKKALAFLTQHNPAQAKRIVYSVCGGWPANQEKMSQTLAFLRKLRRITNV